MYEWHEAIQKMIDWIELHLTDEPTLMEISRQIGYSPSYCSMQFHRLCGVTIKNYVAGRRLARAAIDLRDTDERILDIAVKYGFSSQEALTRAFKQIFDCTPGAYRRQPVPVPLPIYKVIFFPEHYQALHHGEENEDMVTEARWRLEYIPAHKYLGIWDKKAQNYCEFWEGKDCDRICGIIDSLSHVSDPLVTGHTAGWYLGEDGRRRYLYGTGLVTGYAGEVPEGFELRDIPEGYYVVFFHPPFDFLTENVDVMGRVEELAWHFDLEKEYAGKFAWDEQARPCYQRHYPEGRGYEVLRPVKMK
ncbi:MAG: helix-turn-helix transcriptional regulator [Clostridiales bacterium]|nr:helix-turn-helix transcriptional regulator [Clostridiales bacterium]